MSELKAIQIPKITNIFGRVIGVTEYYLKSEADKVIAELKEKHKTEIKELLCLIRDKENNFNRAFDSVEKELRATRRALWLARAKRANEHYHRYHGRFLPDIKLTDIPEYNKWIKVEKLCRAKAEEYK